MAKQRGCWSICARRNAAPAPVRRSVGPDTAASIAVRGLADATRLLVAATAAKGTEPTRWLPELHHLQARWRWLAPVATAEAKAARQRHRWLAAELAAGMAWQDQQAALAAVPADGKEARALAIAAERLGPRPVWSAPKRAELLKTLQDEVRGWLALEARRSLALVTADPHRLLQVRLRKLQAAMAKDLTPGRQAAWAQVVQRADRLLAALAVVSAPDFAAPANQPETAMVQTLAGEARQLAALAVLANAAEQPGPEGLALGPGKRRRLVEALAVRLTNLDDSAQPVAAVLVAADTDALVSQWLAAAGRVTP